MAQRSQTEGARPGDTLLVIHDFTARSPDELSLAKGDRIELIERDDEFGDGWFLGKHVRTGDNGLFPEVYTALVPKGTGGRRAQGSVAVQKPDASVVDAVKRPASTSQSQSEAPRDASRYDSKLPDPTPPPTAPLPTPPIITTSTGQISHSPESLSASFNQPHIAQPAPSNPSTPRRVPSTGSNRSYGYGNGVHENSPVMNETLSVIEEHITDLKKPRNNLLGASGLRNETNYSNGLGGAVQHRLSYINGDETDEEESGGFTEAEVTRWTPEQVAQLLKERGVDEHQCNVFREEEITGEVLLQMDQSAVMLQQFDLGKMGKRLALWHKISDFQIEVRGPTANGRPRHSHAASTGSIHDTNRARSASVGPVLPRIPSLMDQHTGSGAQQNRRSIASQHSLIYADGLGRDDSSLSASKPNHTRRHSAMEHSDPGVSQDSLNQSVSQKSGQGNHAKHSSFDRGWTMNSEETANDEWPRPMETSSKNSKYLSPEPTELGMTVVSALDLDRGYFSGNEAESRRARNVLRKRESPTHARAPSDGYNHSNHKRLSYVFRQKRTNSSDSIPDAYSSIVVGPGAKSPRSPTFKENVRAASSPQINKTLRSASPMPPTVTKLEYDDSPSLDAVANSPPLVPPKGAVPPTAQGRFAKVRATGLRAISDAITGEEKAQAQDRIPATVKESPDAQLDDSSTPSINSRSIDIDDSSIIKSTTASTGKTTPNLPPAPRRKGKKETSAYTRGLVKKPPAEQMVGCDYSGWMKKKSSNLMTTWKTRLFVLRGRRLSYYYSEDDTEEKGLIDISFHRVLPANNDRITGLHATVTGAANSPVSPQNAQIETIAATDAAKAAADVIKTGLETPSGMFIFKLVPPRTGLSKAVNFTKPTVHYFAVDNIQQGRLWMAALMKATIDRDENAEVITTYNQKTISLAKAKAMRQRPPFLAQDDDEKSSIYESAKESEKTAGLNIDFDNVVTPMEGSSLAETKEESISGDTKRGSVSSGRNTLSSSLARTSLERPASKGGAAAAVVGEASAGAGEKKEGEVAAAAAAAS